MHKKFLKNNTDPKHFIGVIENYLHNAVHWYLKRRKNIDMENYKRLISFFPGRLNLKEVSP